MPDAPRAPLTAGSVATRGVNLWARGAVLAVATAVVALFMQRTLHQSHGLGTAIVLGLASLALLAAGGPSQLARRVGVDGAGLRIERYTLVRTRISWAELVDARAEHGALILVPTDRARFFDEHRELRDSATAEGVRIPLGRRAGVTDEVAALLPPA